MRSLARLVPAHLATQAHVQRRLLIVTYTEEFQIRVIGMAVLDGLHRCRAFFRRMSESECREMDQPMIESYSLVS